MDLEDFKQIFFWEWFHRFLGRLIGLVYALPLFYFWIRKQIPSGFKLPLLILLILGGMQGVVGWVMVKSGLVDQPSVSHYRLAAHLLLALLIYALLIWNALALAPFKKSSDKILYAHAWAVAALLTLTLLWGAFTAGLDAGLIYNESFPQMGGQWIPTEITNAAAPLHALFESPAGVQFTHRCLAIVTFACIISFWLHAWRRKNTFPAIHALMVMGFIQVGLGISTLLSGVELPLAVMHQAGAVLVLTFLVMSLKRLEA